MNAAEMCRWAWSSMQVVQQDRWYNLAALHGHGRAIMYFAVDQDRIGGTKRSDAGTDLAQLDFECFLGFNPEGNLLAFSASKEI